ncbi:hypothetical protein TrVFT333_004705 [Trichoderma virens FT-333]|nr:hypothetical protein TrVFT333_004705 [Trichoderma virens FT-333]
MNTPFSSLFHFLNEFDEYNHDSKNRHLHGSISIFTPKFDVCELEDAYELHGELPGLNKTDLQIEFTDKQTLLVHGLVQRSYNYGSPSESFLFLDNPTMSGAITEGKSEQASTQAKKKASTKDSTEIGKGGDTSRSRYWIAERRVGEFSRTFTFARQVDEEGVTAKLEDGILTVHVPKIAKPSSRRIEVA